eukprot:978224_1
MLVKDHPDIKFINSKRRLEKFILLAKKNHLLLTEVSPGDSVYALFIRRPEGILGGTNPPLWGIHEFIVQKHFKVVNIRMTPTGGQIPTFVDAMKVKQFHTKEYLRILEHPPPDMSAGGLEKFMAKSLITSNQVTQNIPVGNDAWVILKQLSDGKIMCEKFTVENANAYPVIKAPRIVRILDRPNEIKVQVFLQKDVLAKMNRKVPARLRLYESNETVEQAPVLYDFSINLIEARQGFFLQVSGHAIDKIDPFPETGFFQTTAKGAFFKLPELDASGSRTLVLGILHVPNALNVSGVVELEDGSKSTRVDVNPDTQTGALQRESSELSINGGSLLIPQHLSSDLVRFAKEKPANDQDWEKISPSRNLGEINVYPGGKVWAAILLPTSKRVLWKLYELERV